MSAWQDIDTAPEGKALLLACADWPMHTRLGKPMPIKVGDLTGGVWRIYGASWTPTHWMPLPEPPTS